MAFKTTPDKKKQFQMLDPRKPNREDQSKPKPNEENRRSAKRKITFKTRNATTTAIVNPMVQTISTTMGPSYSPVMSYGYTPQVPVITTVTPYVQPVFTGYSYPDTNWTVSVSSPVFSLPMPSLPVTMLSPIMPSQVCPYTSIVPSPYTEGPPPVPFASPMRHFDCSYQDYRPIQCDQIVPSSPRYVKTFDINRNQKTSSKIYKKQNTSDLGSYLRLPKELFPKARMLRLDPNPIINEICLEDNIDEHYPWILDLEFGIPRIPVTRPIAVYDVQFNSVHCKNTPGAIHPVFESCSQDLKRAFLFYYDCIISSWYKGFIEMNHDNSVAHFQSWLKNPMQVFGMCWP